MKILSVLCTLLVLAMQTLSAQNTQSVALLQTYDASGRPLARASAFFVDAQGTAISHRDVFINAASAKIITLDSTVHSVVRIVGEDDETGLVKFSVDNNLTKQFAALKVGTLPKEGDALNLISAQQIQKNDARKAPVAQVITWEEYGQATVVAASIQKSEMGSPLLHSNGDLAGVATMDLLADKSKMLLIPASSVANIPGKSMDFATWVKQMKPDNAFMTALAALIDGNKDKAISQLASSISKNPKNTKALLLSSRLMVEKQQYSKVLEEMNKVMAVDANIGLAYYYRGLARYYTKGYAEAIADLTKAEELKVNKSAIKALRGMAYYETNQLPGAISDLTQAVAGPEAEAVHFLTLANAEFKTEAYSAAIPHYTKAIEMGNKEAGAGPLILPLL